MTSPDFETGKTTALCAKGPFGTCPRESFFRENKSPQGLNFFRDVLIMTSTNFGAGKTTALCAKGPKVGTCPRESFLRKKIRFSPFAQEQNIGKTISSGFVKINQRRNNISTFLRTKHWQDNIIGFVTIN
jgi:hypothetical protein